MRDQTNITSTTTTKRMQPNLSALRKEPAQAPAPIAADAATPNPTTAPTPVMCWADDVHDEFRTPGYGGQLPPDQPFGPTPVATPIQGDVAFTNEWTEEQGAAAVNASQVLYRELSAADTYAATEYVQYQQHEEQQQQYYYYEGAAAQEAYGANRGYEYAEDQEVGSYSRQSSGTIFAPPPPPQQMTPEMEANRKDSMLRWYEHVVAWAVEAFEICGTSLPPPPPPPVEGCTLPQYLQAYTFNQWCDRVQRWHEYVTKEYYYNVMHPETTLRARSGQVNVPANYYENVPSNYNTTYTPPPATEVPFSPPMPSYAIPRSPQRSPQLTYQHNPYASTAQEPQPLWNGGHDTYYGREEYAPMARRQTSRA
jgi:hypothetical protein